MFIIKICLGDFFNTTYKTDALGEALELALMYSKKYSVEVQDANTGEVLVDTNEEGCFYISDIVKDFIFKCI